MSRIALQMRLDETTHKKLKVISEKELRSLNAQIEYFILRGIQDYEADHGSISLEE